MEVTQGILLPVLLAAIVANTVILMLVVVAARVSRRERTRPATTRSAIEGSMLSTSFIDRSGRSTWESSDRSAAAAARADEAADAVEAADAAGADNDGSDPEGSASELGDTDTGETDDADDTDDAAANASGATSTLDDDRAEATSEADAGPASGGSGVPDETSGLDVLTGLLDQSAFTRLVIAEDIRIHRYHRPATVVIFELEGLDRLIDRLGQDAADRIVPALADTMRRLARDVDHVARLAPGRFGVLLPETDEVAAINYVERVRRACELWLESGAIALRLATGWAGTTGDPTLVQAQRLATDRMYGELRRETRRAAER